MSKRKPLIGLVALGLTAAAVAPTTHAFAATKTTKKAVKTTKKASTTKSTTPATTATTAAVTTRATAAPTPTAAPAGARGGKIVFGLEGESSQGFLPSESQWAVSGHQVSYAIIERLMGVTEKGEFVPWLAESMTPSADYRTWTIRVRSGVKFHNGEALDGAAVEANLKNLACGSVTRTALFPLNGALRACPNNIPVTSSGQTVTVNLFTPWVSFPSYMSGQTGTIVAPAQIRASEPARRNQPIGTGPFKFKEWVLNDHFTVTKNADYWQKGLPIADELEFRPIPDEAQRLAQLQSGQLQYMHTNNFLTMRELASLEKDKKIKVVDSEEFGELSYDMLNTGVPPFNNLDCRLAAAYAQDVDTLIKLRAPTANRADGPFPPGSLGYLPKSGLPDYNPDKARDHYAKCKAANGGRDVEFVLGTTTVPDNIETSKVQKQMLEAIGFKVSLFNLEQQAFIGGALAGKFQWLQWRSHGGTDPDQQRIWWHSETALPICPTNSLEAACTSLNFSRIKDSIIDSSLDQIRGNSDPAVRKRAAENLNRTFGENAYNLWRWRSRWTLAMCATCSGYENQRTVGGEKIPPLPSGHVPGLGVLTGK